MKLICIGDSLTFGYGVRPSQRWTRLCAQETGGEIVNEGISGDTTGGMLVGCARCWRSVIFVCSALWCS